MRELLVIIFILGLIIFGTLYTHKYLDDTTNILVKYLEEINEGIKNKKLAGVELKDKSEKLYKEWGKINKNWSNIVLHEEIDNIETALIKMKSKIEIGNLDESLEDIETCIFLVKHIKEKEKTTIKNIF